MAAQAFDLATALLSLGLAVGLVRVAPGGAGLVVVGALVLAAAVAIRLTRSGDPFYRLWVPATASLVALAALYPSFSDWGATAAASLAALALVVGPGIPALRLWAAAGALAIAGSRAMEAAALTGSQRAVVLSLAGGVLAAVGSTLVSPL